MQHNDTKDLAELWQLIIDGANPENTAKLWLDSCSPLGIEGGELVIEANNQFVKQYVTDNFLPKLIKAAVGSGRVTGIQLRCSSSSEEDEEKKKKREERAEQASRQQQPSFMLNPSYTFESFVVGKSNRMAYSYSLAVAETADTPNQLYNPLFIYGGVGLGKTHLMHAICHYALRRLSGMRVIYVSSDKFVNDFIKALQLKQTDQFKDNYRNADILLIDDIQFLGGKESSQEEFFHTFNTLHDGRKQIVICSDRKPKELNGMTDRLISRFECGLVTDVQQPDLETRIAILQNKADLRGCAIDSNIIHFLALHIPSNIRELQGALNRLIASSEMSGEPITIDNTSIWLKDILRTDVKSPTTVEDIQSVVAEEFGLSIDDLTSSKRTAELAYARQIAMFLCREMTDTSLQSIARAFRKKDHTTVIHAQRKVGDQIKTDAEMKEIVDKLKNKL